jgi:hypothetical protein
MDSLYPVLEERPLAPVPRRFLRGGRRDMSELPPWHPGYVLVFDTGRDRIALREHTHLTGAEEVVVEAVAVSVIDIRPRRITAQLVLPSASAADDFTVHADFRCTVTDPAVVARHGVFDLGSQLAEHLRRDRKLLGLGGSHSVERIADVRDVVEARVEAYWEYHPLEVPGLDIRFTSTSVLTPAELRAHEQNMRNERWRQDYSKLASLGEDAQISRMRDLVADGSAGLTALGLARREIHPVDAVRDARENEQIARDNEQITKKQLAETIRHLQESGRLDYVPIDVNGLVGAWYEQLTGHGMPQPAARQFSVADPPAITGNNEEEDSEPLDEADLDF